MSKNEMQWLCNGIKIAETRINSKDLRNGYKPDFSIVFAKILLCDKISLDDRIFDK